VNVLLENETAERESLPRLRDVVAHGEAVVNGVESRKQDGEDANVTDGEEGVGKIDRHTRERDMEQDIRVMEGLARIRLLARGYVLLGINCEGT